MLRKFVCAAVVAVIGLGVALADEIPVLISKADGGKITYKKMAAGKGGGKKAATEGDDITMPVKADAKITKGVPDPDTKGKLNPGDAITDGLKNDMFTKIPDTGLRATITTDADNKNVTAITVGGGGGKKKKGAE